ncbi:hypothetical protein STENOSP10_15180 [Stenotrophomonas sepilia]|uniref:Transposase n=1 Tax=Stenotrophomonas sepilia TaxID=2860290 RepID=A0ABQ6QAY8_9GAMM|nr:hypothetical protein STENOSP10_15180 [Stenotrophomonas sepilia]
MLDAPASALSIERLLEVRSAVETVEQQAGRTTYCWLQRNGRTSERPGTKHDMLQQPSGFDR